MTDEVIHRSHSQITTFASCGEAYRLQKIAEAPQAPAAWFAQGTAFHEVVEYWERNGRVENAAVLQDMYRAIYDREIAAERERVPDLSEWLTGGRTKPENDLAARRDRGAAQVAGYVEYALGADETIAELPDGSPAIEWEFNLNLDGIIVKGAIDQVIVYPNGTLGVRDLKTGTKKPEWGFQLGIYALAWEWYFGDRIGWGDFYMAKNNAPEPPSDLSPFTWERVSRWVRNMDKAVRLGHFVPNVGDSCRICLVRRYCDAIGAEPETFAPELYQDNYESENE